MIELSGQEKKRLWEDRLEGWHSSARRCPAMVFGAPQEQAAVVIGALGFVWGWLGRGEGGLKEGRSTAKTRGHKKLTKIDVSCRDAVWRWR